MFDVFLDPMNIGLDDVALLSAIDDQYNYDIPYAEPGYKSDATVASNAEVLKKHTKPKTAPKTVNTSAGPTLGQRATNYGSSALGFLGGKSFADEAQRLILKKLGPQAVNNPFPQVALNGPVKNAGKLGKVARFAGGNTAHGLLRAVPGLATAGALLSAGDVVFGNDSVGNKVMDTVGMGIGGVLGMAGGPVGVAAGIQGGKILSDATQWLFGGGKSPEQQKLEQALQALNSRSML